MKHRSRSSLHRSRRTGNPATLGFEERLWAAADTLRGHIDAAEYKHIVLGLVFLKYLADLFEAPDACGRWARTRRRPRGLCCEERDLATARSQLAGRRSKKPLTRRRSE